MSAIQAWVKGASSLDDAHVLWSLYNAPRPPAPWIELNIQESRAPAHDWTTKARNVFHFADQPVSSVNTSTDALAIAAHPFTTGAGPVRITAVTAPGGLSVDTDYWVVVADSSHVQMATSFQNTGGNYLGNPITVVDITSAGVGPIAVVQRPTTTRAGIGVTRTAEGIREIHLEIQVFGALASGIQAFSLAQDVIAAIPLYLYSLDLAGVGISDLGVSFVQGSVRATTGFRGELIEPRATMDVVIYVASSLSAYSDFIESVQLAARLETSGGESIPEIDVTIRS